MQPDYTTSKLRSLQSKRVLALITARGGSKGLPRKNVLPVGGKPLIAWTVEAAILAECVDRVVLSSDDDHAVVEGALQGPARVAISGVASLRALQQQER